MLASTEEETVTAHATVVLDVGRTKVRVCAVDPKGTEVVVSSCENRALPGPPYPHFDVDALFAWIVEGLGRLARDSAVGAIVPVAHGACAALLGEDDLVLPVLDYEFEGVCEIDSDYEREARDFARTGSPRLPMGLNLGRQLFWLERTRPREFARATTLIPAPQYWAWRLTGARCYEPTSLGCHTDLWDPRASGPSPFAERRGWDRLLPERVHAWTAIGGLTPELRRATGIADSARVLAGIHDSNASYFAHRARRERPFTVVATGTWIICMACGGDPPSLSEDRDTLANVDAFGDAVPTARFMGGREYAAICGGRVPPEPPSVEELGAVLDRGTLALPAFSAAGGPFPGRVGEIVGPAPRTPRESGALAALYCALVTDVALDLVGARGDLIVEGPFARNPAYASALAGLRAPLPVLLSGDATGTLEGARLLADWPAVVPATALDAVPGSGAEALARHRERWRSASR
jgi:sugar (pentulose or hexulose) kinase